MDYQWIFTYSCLFGILGIATGCIFHSKPGSESEADGVRFIRLREDMRLGSEILTLKAYPRNSILLKGLERSTDHTFFRIKEVNSTVVQIILNKSLEDLVDRENPQNVLKFKVECSSKKGRQDDTAFLAITAYIEDVNDHFPQFQNLPYAISIDESTAIGTTVFKKISAFDRDKPNTPNSDIQYSLGAQDTYFGEPYFSLESPHKPIIILRRELDFDNGPRSFNLLIYAADRGTPPKTSNTSVEINVLDNDDLPPKFTEGVYRTRINEFSPLTGKPVYVPLMFKPPIMAFDQDTLNTTLIYNIISGNERKLFSVNPKNGVMVLEKEIDLEEESLPGNTFVLQLEARQEDSPLKRALARIEIEILDLNDNVPEFEVDLYNISIVENLPSGFSVLQVNAADRDQGENAEFLYVLTNEAPSGAFSIDTHTGWITVKDQGLLDREARSYISMSVQAKEKVTPHLQPSKKAGSVDVEITLLDSNDNTPTFGQGNLYEFKVSVTSPIDHILGKVIAQDPDEGPNGMIKYELQRPKGSGAIPFRLDSQSGALIVSGLLHKGRIALFVEASDQPLNPSERRFSLAVVTIEVMQPFSDGDIDFIDAPYEFWVGNDVPIGTSVGQIRTTLDYEKPDVVMFDLLHSYENGVPFAVEERSGIITVIRELENFERKLYEFEAVATYRMDEKSYGLTRRTSKYESRMKKNGEIIEIDEGIISDTDDVLVTNVTVHVVSPDDERGILLRGTDSDPIEFHVKENAAGALIGQLLYNNTNLYKADEFHKKDHDSIIRPGTYQRNSTYAPRLFRSNRQMVSKLKNTENSTQSPSYKRKHRDTNAETFVVEVAPSIFYEESFTINNTTESIKNSTDPGSDSKSYIKTETRSTKIIESSMYQREGRQVDDDLDTAATSREVVITPRPVTRVNTRSQRRMTTIAPNITHEEQGMRFIIANQNDVTDMINITNDGVLMTIKGLDRELRDVYRLTVIAEYSKGLMMGAGIYQITIHVDDENDNAPTFGQRKYTGMISENSPLGSDVYLNYPILVSDQDIGDNALFNVSITGEGSNLFSVEFVNSTNEVKRRGYRTRSQIDNARSHPDIEKSFSSLQVMFADYNQSIPNAPHFVVRFVGPNVLDREKQDYYNLKLVAKDHGGLTSSATLGILIADVNDNAPNFEKIAIYKNSGVSVIEYTDDIEFYYADHMLNVNEFKERVSNATLISLKTDTNKGIIKLGEISPIGMPRQIKSNATAYSLHRRRLPTKSLGGKQPRSMKAYPFFSVMENVMVGAPLMKITATDEDYEANAQVYYEIVSEIFIPARQHPRQLHLMKFFDIDRHTGEIKVNRALPAESEIRINITAKDSGGLSDFFTIKFKVLDVNDHAPVFKKSWYSFDIEEGSYSGQVIERVEATDEDFGENANITFTIDSSVESLPFSISQITGTITVNGAVDREERDRYEFKVIASDNSKFDPKLTSFSEVEINIIDLNDNSPEFIGYDEIFYSLTRKEIGLQDDDQDDMKQSAQEVLPIYKAYINKNSEPGTFVKQISAMDRDFGGNGNGLVMFALHHNKFPHVFEIDSRDGMVTTISKFHGFNGYDHVNLTIIASDLGSPSRSSTALLLVNLQGEIEDEEADSRLFPHKYYEVEVQENNEYPMTLLRINVTQLYKDTMFKWSIINEGEMNLNDMFTIDENNGTVWLTDSLDREDKDYYKIKVKAEAIGRGGRNIPILRYPIAGEMVRDLKDNELRIVLKVTDDNDNTPKFIGNGGPIVAVIPNTASFGLPVTKVVAEDADIGLNAEVRYSLLSDSSNMFGIDPKTGIIRVLRTVDANKRVFGFDVKATDRKGADDGKSAIANIFVYVLDDNRQVRLVINGQPIDVEKEIEQITNMLSEATGYDIRVRLLEPHINDLSEEKTDVYIYAVDLKSNSIVGMDTLQDLMSTLNMSNLTTSAQVFELVKFDDQMPFRPKYITRSSLGIPELAAIILALVVFAGGLSTIFCVVCVRYKRRRPLSEPGLAYSLTRPPSTIRTDSKSSRCSKQIVAVSIPTPPPHFFAEKLNTSRERPREYIDVPLPQSVQSAYNIVDHESACLRYNQIRTQQPYVTNTSVASRHSSGHDSGLEIMKEEGDRSSSQINDMGRRRRDSHSHNCYEQKSAADHKHCDGEDSSDSYEDSLKNGVLDPSRRSLPRLERLQRNVAVNPSIGMHRGVRHSFSGVNVEMRQQSPILLNRQGVARTSMSDLEERLRNLERSFHEPFHLNNL